MWTSRQQLEVLNIVQAEKYPEVFTEVPRSIIDQRWLKFRIFYHILTPCADNMSKAC